MKFRLSYKIFATLTLTSLVVVALMVGLIRFYVARNFADYVNRSLLERYSNVAAALATEYQIHNGWQVFKDHPQRWQEILQTSLPSGVLAPVKRPLRPTTFENKGFGSSDQDMPAPRLPKRVQRLARRLALFDFICPRD